MSFSYQVPASISEAVSLLGELGNDAKLLAGGTDLVIQLQADKYNSNVLIDISRLDEMRKIERTNDSLIVGSLCTFDDLCKSSLIVKYAAALAQASAAVGSPQIRNQGTLGGNLANGSPAADSIPALMALEAQVGVASAHGVREVKLEKLLGGVGFTNLTPHELITYFRIPFDQSKYSAFAKLGRRNALAIARISVGITVAMSGGEIVAGTLALGAVGPKAYRVEAVEKMLVGRRPARELWPDIEEALSAQVAEKLGDRASAPYKRQAVKGVVSAAWERLVAGMSLNMEV